MQCTSNTNSSLLRALSVAFFLPFFFPPQNPHCLLKAKMTPKSHVHVVLNVLNVLKDQATNSSLSLFNEEYFMGHQSSESCFSLVV